MVSSSSEVLNAQIEQATILTPKLVVAAQCDDVLEAWHMALETIRINDPRADALETDAILKVMEVAHKAQVFARSKLLLPFSDQKQDAILRRSVPIVHDLAKNITGHYKTCGDYLFQNPGPEEQIAYDRESRLITVASGIRGLLSDETCLQVPTDTRECIWQSGVSLTSRVQ
jgi:hypothetical protein